MNLISSITLAREGFIPSLVFYSYMTMNDICQ